MIPWNKVLDKAYHGAPRDPRWHWWDIECIDNLSKCLGAAATEHARLRYTMYTVFGWPFNGRY